jgi:hypothetical protein
VTIKVDNSNFISFYIDGRLERDNNIKNKVAITKWLLKEFKKIGKDFLYLFAIPFEKDGYGEVRKIIFNKLGFIPSYRLTTLVWFNNSLSFEEREEIINLLPKFEEGEFEEDENEDFEEDFEEDDGEIISWDSLKF